MKCDTPVVKKGRNGKNGHGHDVCIGDDDDECEEEDGPVNESADHAHPATTAMVGRSVSPLV